MFSGPRVDVDPWTALSQIHIVLSFCHIEVWNAWYLRRSLEFKRLKTLVEFDFTEVLVGSFVTFR